MLAHSKVTAYSIINIFYSHRLLAFFILLLVALIFPSLVLAEGSPGNTTCPGC